MGGEYTILKYFYKAAPGSRRARHLTPRTPQQIATELGEREPLRRLAATCVVCCARAVFDALALQGLALGSGESRGGAATHTEFDSDQ